MTISFLREYCNVPESMTDEDFATKVCLAMKKSKPKKVKEIKKELHSEDLAEPQKKYYESLLNLGWSYVCPVCEVPIGININYSCTDESNYCDMCGQKLDWD